MKRYLLFTFTEYEANGGIDDLIGDYNSIDEALKSLDDYLGRHYIEFKHHLPHIYRTKKEYIEYHKRFQTTHIYDTVERVKVYET